MLSVDRVRKGGPFGKLFLVRNVLLQNIEILENPQTVEKQGESDHILEILENLEIWEILEIPPVFCERPLSK